MAEKQIAWASGDGYITVIFGGDGNGSVSVSSDENESYDAREQNITIITTYGSPQQTKTVTVRQAGKRLAVGTVINFDYTGTVQEVTLPPGQYKLQCWGAQGGNVTGSYSVAGSKGGYSEGVLTITSAKTIYIFVGGRGASYTSSATQTSTSTVNGGWNGGGAGLRTARYNTGGIDGRSFPRPGGGATDMALTTSSMSYSSGVTNRSSASLLSRFIVAGGGAGASAYYTITETTDTEIQEEWVTIDTFSGTADKYSSGQSAYYAISDYIPAVAGDQYKVTRTASSANKYMLTAYSASHSTLKNNTNTTMTAPADTAYIRYWIFATTQGETVSGYLQHLESVTVEVPSTDTASGTATTSKQGGGTSGKGQYPGTQSSGGSGGGAFGVGGSQTSSNYRYCSGAGGGGWYGGGQSCSDSSTSYINYTGGGSGFVNTSANKSYRPSGYTGLQLDSGSTTAGSSSHPSTSGGTETGHSGNGYAKITVLG